MPKNMKLQSINNCIIIFIVFCFFSALIACSSTPVNTLQAPVQMSATNFEATIKGIAFHDYNGNGTKEYKEPFLPDSDFELVSIKGDRRFKIKTDENGIYSLSLPAGTYNILINETIPGYNDRPFNFLYLSPEEVNRTDELLQITINRDRTFDIALTQGFLTLPYSVETGSYITTLFFDLDKREGFIRDWQGGQETYDQHLGIDYRLPEGTPVIAAAPGRVISSEYDSKSGNVITLSHGLFVTRYGHLKKREVRTGDIVIRGQRIGSSGATGEWVGQFPHAHFELNVMILPSIDVYRDITDPESTSYWTVDNNPQYP
ncbi:peptidoglycan DD-metalloendopeptidase family protein [Chloroflexota bacterium]